MKGNISIHRYQSNEEPHHGVHIELKDESSGVRVVDIDLTIEQFGNAVSGLGYTDCLFELGFVSYVGKVREHKIEKIIRWFGYGEIRNEDLEKVLKDYEIDGWKANRADFKNHHRYNDDHTISVSFVRYV